MFELELKLCSVFISYFEYLNTAFLHLSQEQRNSEMDTFALISLFTS